MADVFSKVLPFGPAQSLEFLEAWLNTNNLSRRLLGFMALYPTAPRPDS
jgi:hypothetical protein